MVTRRLWNLCAVMVATATLHSALAQAPPSSLPVVEGYQQQEPPEAVSAPGWREHHTITRRLEAIETENAQLRAELVRAEDDQLLQMIATPAHSIASTSSPSGSVDHAGFYPQCDQCAVGSTNLQNGHCGCDTRRCHWCPPAEAPCVDCPRVTTLQPYFNAEIFGLLKLDMLFNTARPEPPGSPFYLRNRRPLENHDNTLSIHARASLLGLALKGPDVGPFQSGGLATVFFFNDSVSDDRYGILPLNVWGELRNDDWRISAGLQLGVFNSRNPTMLVWGALGSSGNSGNVYKGQLRIERYFHVFEDAQWTYKLALTEPVTTTINSELSINDDNGWPNIESRLSYGLGPAEGGLIKQRPFEIGVSGLVGQVRTEPVGTTEVVADIWGLGTDLHWEINDHFGVNSEFFTGQGLGSYTAGIAQTTNTVTFQSIRTTGGFAELYCYMTESLHTHWGYGIDDPVDRDLDPSQRARNQTYFSNILWDVTPLFRVGFEFTWRETDYVALIDNEGAGFHTQLQWKF